MMPEGRMYQAATQVNVLSPVSTNVVEVDALHFGGRQYHGYRYRKGNRGSTGVLGSGMIQDGRGVNLGRPLSSLLEIPVKYAGTSQNRQGLANGSMVGGLTGSTRSVGEPRTWGSGQQWRDGFSSCLADTQRSGKCRR